MGSHTFPFFSCRRIATFCALLFAVLWVPVTSHELLESADWIHHDEAGDHAPSHDAADGNYRANAANILVKAPASLGIGCFVAPLEVYTAGLLFPLQVTLPLRPATESPPGLVRTWQFALRLALPSRAPSAVA